MIRWQRNLTRAVLALALVAGLGGPAFAAKGQSEKSDKLDRVLRNRAGRGGTSRVIITLKSGSDPSSDVRKLGGRLGRKLGLINGHVVELPNAVIRRLADLSFVESIHYDRPTGGEMNRVAVTVGARAAQLQYGYTGAGVGVAVIDSGVTSWHDDLTYNGSSSAVRVKNGQRVAAFMDFVNGRTAPYDDNGHGTHVAGIIAGNGADSLGVRAGIAPAAHLVSLKVLDDRGRGVISDVIAALDWAVTNKTAYNIRVINLSVGAAVTESYKTDPLTLAAKRAVDAGIVVVTAAGNLGKNANGETQYGAITAPGNAPWVLTVGAYSHEGTIERYDDVMAGYSSRGPTAVDFQAKPDLVAPGTGIVSLSSPSSNMYYSKPQYLLTGSLLNLNYKPYLSLTGTSMASPVVAGTVALMLQANPSLTPNMVKAILQYTAQIYPSYNALTQGAGFLNAQGAVQLARFYRTAVSGSKLTIPREWGKQVIWGNHRLRGGIIRPNANAFQSGVTWGSAVGLRGENIVWGTLQRGDNIVWGTVDFLSAANLVWGTVRDSLGDNLVWGTFGNTDNLVWGTLSGDDNIVWGTDCGGSKDCDNLVWGTAITADNLVWGTAQLADNLVWGTAQAGDNLVWGTSGDIDNLVWGTASDDDNLTWGSSGEDAPLFDDPIGAPVNFDQTVFQSLFGEPLVTVPPAEQSLLTQPVSSTLNVVGITGGF